MAAIKGPGEAKVFDGSNLRIGIVHARWNMQIIEPLLQGTKAKLLASGVKEHNIVVQSVPGSWELPIAARGMYLASQVESSKSSSGPSLTAGDLLGGSVTDLTLSSSSAQAPINPLAAKSKSGSEAPSTAPFDALVAIGVLIKGETMHFEYIADKTTEGLMRVQLDQGVPLILGLLTVLNEEQAMTRAGLGVEGKVGKDGYKAHNHGEDWGLAAVELGVRRREWADGKIL